MSIFLTNPVVLSVIAMSVLCLLRLNVFLSIVVAAFIAGFTSHMSITHTMDLIISGMKGNLNTVTSYVFLGILAVAISQGNLAKVLIYKLTSTLGKKRYFFCFFIAFIACFSQNLIPIHIAFIPILIPPLIGLMNAMKLDRRAVACALAFGLEAPYVCIPIGFGLIFQTIIRDQMIQNGIPVSISDIASVMWIGGVGMLVGLIVAILVLYRKPRDYGDLDKAYEVLGEVRMERRDYLTLLAAIVAFGIQIFSSSLPLGGFVGIMLMIAFGVIKWREMDGVIDSGVKSMAFISFVMLIATGYGEVLKESGAVKELVEVTAGLVSGKFGGAFLMLFIGLLITMGIGTSFGTLPVIAAFYCPLCMELGFSISASILLLGVAAALGDAGSPAAETTIGPTVGLNIDGKHNHIWDTCIPTFLAYNVPLFIFGLIGAMILG